MAVVPAAEIVLPQEITYLFRPKFGMFLKVGVAAVPIICAGAQMSGYLDYGVGLGLILLYFAFAAICLMVAPMQRDVRIDAFLRKHIVYAQHFRYHCEIDANPASFFSFSVPALDDLLRQINAVVNAGTKISVGSCGVYFPQAGYRYCYKERVARLLTGPIATLDTSRGHIGIEHTVLRMTHQPRLVPAH